MCGPSPEPHTIYLKNPDHAKGPSSTGFPGQPFDEASNVSQGQKQLLTITQAVQANPRILVLDEATSSVNTHKEVLIQQAMNSLMKDRTSHIIAHHLCTIRDTGLILVMHDGDIVERGNHEELVASNGFCAELYNSQFERALAVT